MTSPTDDWSDLFAWRHREGVPWHQAPVPPVDHECFVQTQGWIGLDQWARCACGAIADGIRLRAWRDVNREHGTDFSAVERGIWAERNSRET